MLEIDASIAQVYRNLEFIYWARSLTLGVTPEALLVVVVDYAGGLHPCIDNDRANEFEAALLE